ncbi:hypothetical protein, partial [Gilvimarinus sp. 1_MG-2023]|uniref:hypothetical protein n=1 Tax=Gilvimarinus sp. 1_MG-2023 TaxID=3062638 RepID=UPI0026E272D5
AQPQDVNAHLQGGIPTVEVDALQPFWGNYIHLRMSIFEKTEKENYDKFKDNIESKEDIKALVLAHDDIALTREQYTKGINQWWNN